VGKDGENRVLRAVDHIPSSGGETRRECEGLGAWHNEKQNTNRKGGVETAAKKVRRDFSCLNHRRTGGGVSREGMTEAVEGA